MLFFIIIKLGGIMKNNKGFSIILFILLFSSIILGFFSLSSLLFGMFFCGFLKIPDGTGGTIPSCHSIFLEPIVIIFLICLFLFIVMLIVEKNNKNNGKALPLFLFIKNFFPFIYFRIIFKTF